jgi:hypothetical protein
MFIAGTSATLRRLIEDQLVASGGLDGYDVQLFSTRNFTGTITNKVALFLYRVEVDESRRNVDLPASPPTRPAARPSGSNCTTCSPCGASATPKASR